MLPTGGVPRVEMRKLYVEHRGLNRVEPASFQPLIEVFVFLALSEVAQQPQLIVDAGEASLVTTAPPSPYAPRFLPG